MKLISLTTVLAMFVSHTYALTIEPIYGEEKKKKENIEEAKEAKKNKNFHSIRKWKMTIEYRNGDIISKTIIVRKNSNLSALETAFIEAENHLETMENILGYSVSPISNNDYVLLAN